jgi:hypothetical protein
MLIVEACVGRTPAESGKTASAFCGFGSYVEPPGFEGAILKSSFI